MTIRTHIASFDSHAQAARAVQELEAAGFSHDEVSIIAGNTGSTSNTDASADSDSADGAGVGATLGTVLGGGAGLLAGIGALAIPGLGPIVAAGWLVAALTGAGAGAAAGGLLGGLVSSGVDERDAHIHAEGLRRGGSIVTVRAEDTRIAAAQAILSRHSPVDVTAREAEYKASGWTAYGDDVAVMDSTPDGAPGNPRGTMATRGLDDVAGTNVSGARPQNSDGMPGNPRGTAAERAMDSSLGHGTTSGPRSAGQVSPRADDDGSMLSSTPDGTPGNPRGTELSRGIDRVAGTNISGAHPENEKTRR